MGIPSIPLARPRIPFAIRSRLQTTSKNTESLYEHNIHNPAVIKALLANGYTCKPEYPDSDSPWYLTNIHLEHGESITLPDETTLIAWGCALKTIQEDREEDDAHPKWGITMHQAAEALIVMTGNGPMRITDQWGSIRAGYIEPADLIGDSSDGIEPCGYEEL